MLKRAVAVAAVLALAAPAIASDIPSYTDGPKPMKIGQCVTTRVAELASRLENMPDSGSAVSFVNSISQVSYDIVPAVQESRVGDSVKLCLTKLPSGCPKGDDRGKFYKATNARTHKSWELPDSEHMCGGA
ncbi:MAG: hypothetical protein JO348_06700 [Alphaproteobacteria bacterium]|nr:hypothetical protein [Alphaproteobacteria bacterium]